MQTTNCWKKRCSGDMRTWRSDLKSFFSQRKCGFKSRPGHHLTSHSILPQRYPAQQAVFIRHARGMRRQRKVDLVRIWYPLLYEKGIES